MKKTWLFVIGAHLGIVLWMALWMPIKTSAKKPLQVHTMVAQTPPPPPLALAPKKTTPVKKAPVKKAPMKKPSPTVPAFLARQLQESIAKIEQKSHKEVPKKPLQAPKWIPELKVDGESHFAQDLIECLQNTLELPEVGAVKVELTLNNNGSFIQMRILQSESERNRKFLEEELKALHYPAFSGSLKTEKEHAFVISFCSH
ncbi:MAG: hypothetical protein K1000chlam2_00208 [Chlamydiae bacterium]|nr:hypothetical protein [Chlamydiota bacterium]